MRSRHRGSAPVTVPCGLELGAAKTRAPGGAGQGSGQRAGHRGLSGIHRRRLGGRGGGAHPMRARWQWPPAAAWRGTCQGQGAQGIADASTRTRGRRRASASPGPHAFPACLVRGSQARHARPHGSHVALDAHHQLRTLHHCSIKGRGSGVREHGATRQGWRTSAQAAAGAADPPAAGQAQRGWHALSGAPHRPKKRLAGVPHDLSNVTIIY